MYISLDVYIWLQCRKHTGRPDLRRVGNYLIASSADRKDFEKFRDSEFYERRPLIKTDLLERFMKQKFITIDYINKFGIEFITNFPHSQFDDLCEWTRKILYSGQESEWAVDDKRKRNSYAMLNVIH